MNLFSLGVNILFSWLGNFVSDVWTQIWVSLNGLVYGTITLLYRVFIAIANVNLFDKDIFNKFTERMYLVVGIAMLFIFAYNLVLMIINPEDKKSTGQMTKLVKETIISLVLVVLLPTMFNYMAIFQKNILDSQIITKIIFGNGIDSSTDDCNKYENVKSDVVTSNKSLVDACDEYKDLSPSIKGAYTLTPTLFTAFLYPNNFSINQCRNYLLNGENTIESSDEKELCENYYVGFLMSNFTGNINYLFNSGITNTLKKNSQETLSFNYLLAFVAGIIAIIMFASYTIMIGVRVAKLGFLELIAPIPVMMRIIPKQKEALFDKWVKELKNTYLDIFIRMIIINFALYAVSLVPGVIDQLSGAGDDNQAVVLLAKAVVILGILQFAKETPELIKEFFGSSGRFSIKGGFDKWKDSAHQIGGAAGALGATQAVGGHIAKDVFSPTNWRNWAANIKDSKGVIKKVGAFSKIPVNPLRHVSQLGGAVVSGYKTGKDAKSFSDLRENVYTAASRQMSKPTVGQKIKGFASDERDAFVGYYGTNFSAFDSKHAEEKAKKLDEVNASLKKIEEYLDNKDPVKAINSTYEGLIKQAQDSGVCNGVRAQDNAEAYSKEIEKLYKKWNEDRNRARGRISQELLSKGDEQLKNYLDSYRSVVKNNISIVNESLEVAGKTPIKKVDEVLSDSKFSEDGYSDARLAGKTSGDHAKAIRENIIEEQKKSGNK